MAVLSEIRAVLAVTGTPHPRVEADASVQSEGGGLDSRLAYADTDLDTELIDAARPRGGLQFAAFRVYIDGAEIAPYQRLPGSVQVTRTLGAGSTWSLAFPGFGSKETGGSIRNVKGPPPGLKTVTIDGVYKAASGATKTVRLITDGIVHQARTDGSTSRASTSMNGLDAWGRYDEIPVTLILPPGHGLDRATGVVRRLSQLAGVTSYALASSGRMDKLADHVNTPWIPLAQALLEPASRYLQWDADGRLINPPKVRVGGRYDHIFQRRDLVNGDFGVSATSDGPTRIVVVGSRQITLDGAGRRLEVQVVESLGIYLPVRARFSQSPSTGALSSITPPSGEEASLIRVGLTYIERELEFDVVVRERRVEMGWYNPQKAKYTIDTAGIINGYFSGYILNSDALINDDSPLYQWTRERFVAIRDEETWHRFDNRDFLVQSETDTRGWKIRRERVKDAESPKIAWEETDFINNQPVLANGEGVAELSERFYGPLSLNVSRRNDDGSWLLHSSASSEKVEGRIKDIEVSDDGFVLVEKSALRGWSVRQGSGDFWYEQQGESAEQDEEFQPTGSEIITYVAIGESGHDRLTRKYDADGRLVEANNSFGEPGHLPAATKRIDSTPPASIFDEGEEVSGLAASRQQSQSIKGEFSIPALTANRPARTQPLTSEWAESAQELETIAKTELLIQSAPIATFQLPVNFLVREGQRILVIPWRNTSFPIHVTQVVHQEGDPRNRVPSLTTVTGRWYVTDEG